MKKKFLFRLLAIILFCTASLAIKSETSACKFVCSYAAKKAIGIKAMMATDKPVNPLHRNDGFFIKI
jgi:hypothetical protein